MSIFSTIVTELLEKEINYKGVKVNIFGLPTFLYKNKKSVSDSVRRAKKLGYIDGEKMQYYLTEKGRLYAKKIKDRLIIFERPKEISKKKDLLLMFDIPEDRKGEREWFRYHLRTFGFEMVQRSVWIGPSKFPKEFRDYLKERKMHKFILVFKLAKDFSDDKRHFLL
jgi:DNA-binding transcriptional regulator PaaX